MLMFSNFAHANNLLRCQIDQGGEHFAFDFAPVSDPYSVPSIDINERFRFKALVVGDDKTVQYIKIYVYYETRRQAMILQELKYLQAKAQKNPLPDALTGVQTLYSPDLGREMKYQCALHEVVQ